MHRLLTHCSKKQARCIHKVTSFGSRQCLDHVRQQQIFLFSYFSPEQGSKSQLLIWIINAQSPWKVVTASQLSKMQLPLAQPHISLQLLCHYSSTRDQVKAEANLVLLYSLVESSFRRIHFHCSFAAGTAQAAPLLLENETG